MPQVWVVADQHQQDGQVPGVWHADSLSGGRRTSHPRWGPHVRSGVWIRLPDGSDRPDTETGGLLTQDTKDVFVNPEML